MPDEPKQQIQIESLSTRIGELVLSNWAMGEETTKLHSLLSAMEKKLEKEAKE